MNWEQHSDGLWYKQDGGEWYVWVPPVGNPNARPGETYQGTPGYMKQQNPPGVSVAPPPTSSPAVSPAAPTVDGSGGNNKNKKKKRKKSKTQSAPDPNDPIQPGTDAAGDGTVWDATSQMLVDAGLESLIPWYRQKLTEGASSYEIAILIQEQPAFKNRFKAIEERKQLGLPAISPADVLAYEKQAAGLMRAAGLPQGFYDHYDDYKDLLVSDVSLSELSERIQDGYARVANASTALRSAFFDFFGVQGMDMLAAYFLDPERALPVLTQEVEAAAIGGVGRQFGFDLTAGRSLEFARNQINEAQARQAFMNLTEVRGLFDETFSEANDYRLEYEGLDAVLGISGEALKRLEERRERRVAQFSGQLGGAGVDRFGFHLGAARA